MIGKVQRVMEAREAKDEFEYQDALEELPFEWRHSYPELLCFIVQYMVTILDIRRGQEGIQHLTKDFYEKREENGIKFFAKAIGGKSKNHPIKSQNLENSGIIMYHSHGSYNPGRVYELYLNSLNPSNPKLFQRYKENCGKYSMHDLEGKCLYVNEHVGKHKIAKMLKTLCRAVGKPDNLTNHSCRGDAIVTLFRNNFDSHQIQFLSEHVSLDSLENYHHQLEFKDRVRMAVALKTGSLIDYENHYKKRFEDEMDVGEFRFYLFFIIVGPLVLKVLVIYLIF